MRRARIFLLSAIFLATPGSAAAGVTATAAALHYCHHRADFNLLISSARNMSCRSAQREMRRYRRSIGYRFATRGGFRCRRVSGTRLGGQWRCVKGRMAFRFEFGD